ncbi:histidine phosphatase family protein [Mycobacterium sp. URHD0025]|uniref:histidine phosphatase family protein n=1 Tax=Mycobacterium sp. URHD0025 TaxID=1298864 RepID=UPI00040B23F1|nr:histidine phosphatase family protein [Mycobacterium sp. URHD0025]
MNDPCHPGSFEIATGGRRRRAEFWRFLGITLGVCALLVGAAIPAAAAELMRVTFVRHGQSYGNTSGIIDTSTPGPVLTPKGQQQAQDVVDTLGDNNYDAIYASTMVRTQLTAAPMSQYLGLPIQVLPGLQEIEAGDYEGTPESEAGSGYASFMVAWALGGQRDARIPGSIDGNEFDARVDGALKTMYDKGDRNPVVFSHGGTIMFWTMMNAQNLTLAQKVELLRTGVLDNTDYVVIEGNPEDGWTLVSWNGKEFSPEPTLGAEVKLQARTLTRQLAAAAQQVTDALATGNIATIATAVNRSVAQASFSVVKFNRAVTAKVIHEVEQAVDQRSPATSPSDDPVQSAADQLGMLKAPVAELKAPVAERVKSVAPKKRAELATKDSDTAVPDKTATSTIRAKDVVRRAVQDVTGRVSASVDKVRDGVSQNSVSGNSAKKNTGTASHGNAKPSTAKSDTARDAGKADGADGPRSGHDAA